MKTSKSLSAEELSAILRQILNHEHGEIDKRLVRNPLSDKILGGDRHQIEQILKAIFVNDRPRPLQQLIEHKIYLVVGKNSQTILHWAVEAGAYKCLRLLLHHAREEDIPVFKKDKFQVTPIHLAASRTSSRILKLLLDELAHAEFEGEMYSFLLDSNQRSPFHYAAAHGSLQCCEELIHATRLLGLPIDQRDRFNQTPLMYAASVVGAVNVVRLLASKKPVSISMRNNSGMTALHMAVLARNIPAIRVFLEEIKCAPDMFDAENRTPLHYAALHGYVEEIELLLKNGANVDTRDQKFATAAHYAAQHSVEALKLLLDKSHQDPLDSDNRSTLMWAVAAQNADVVDAFFSNSLRVPILPHAVDKRRQTALHLAALQGNTTIYKKLLGYGWSEKAKDQQSAMPIHLAAGNGHSELIRQYKKAFHNVDEPDDNGKTPLFYACLGQKAHTVRVMVNELDAKPFHKDKLNQTPLHCAAFVGSYPCCSIFIQLGCDIEAKDIYGNTPLSLARGKKNLVELFDQALQIKKANAEKADLDS